MIRLFLVTLICSLRTYSVSTLSTDGYQYRANCTFQSENVVNFAQTYQYDSTVLTTNFPSKMTYKLEVYANIFYTDINTYRIVVKSATFTGLNYWYYDRDNGTWISCSYIGGFSHITINDTVGYSWTNNSTPDRIAFYTSCEEDDYLEVTFNGCFIQPNNTISTNGFNTTDYVSVDGWYIEYPSLNYLDTFSESDTNRVYYELDYNMFYDTLTLLVGTDSSFNDGYSLGYNTGYTDGYNTGTSVGYQTGYADGNRAGIDEGYSMGYQDGVDTDSTASAIYAGIIATGLIPIQFFLSIFNFEIFGINLTGFITSLMSVCIVLIVIKRTFAIHEDD